MIITIDTETQGLNAQSFVLGALCHEDMKVERFFTKKEMYERILKLAAQEKKRRRRLTVYAHHLEYDYIACGAWEDTHNIIYSTHPFIADYYPDLDNRKWPDIKWIDTMGLWRGSLASIGEALGRKKGETPAWLCSTKPYNANFVEMNEAASYCEEDCRILMTFLQQLKRNLKANRVRSNLMITAAQLSMQHFLGSLARNEERKHSNFNGEKGRVVHEGIWLQDIERRELHAPRYPALVQKACRGGRVEAFQTGKHDSVTVDDLNSLYPHVASTMRFPDLATEQRITAPLEHGFTLTTLLKHIGVSRCLVIRPGNCSSLPYLPIRITEKDGRESSCYPGNDTLLYGTWTHLELQGALDAGYLIDKVYESVCWDDGPNPFTEHMPALYAARKASETPFDNAFYKLLMNSLTGKFNQKRPERDVQLISVEALPQYRELGWEPLPFGRVGDQYLIKKDGKPAYKKFYQPIIYALITAGARHRLYGHLNDIPRKSLLYCDTDGIIYHSSIEKHIKHRYSPAMGDWKRVDSHAPYLCYGKKAKMVRDEVTLSRVPKRHATPEAFISGVVEYEDIIGINEAQDRRLVGTTVLRQRDLTEHRETEPRRVYIDTREELTPDILQRLKEALTWQASEAS